MQEVETQESSPVKIHWSQFNFCIIKEHPTPLSRMISTVAPKFQPLDVHAQYNPLLFQVSRICGYAGIVTLAITLQYFVQANWSESLFQTLKK